MQASTDIRIIADLERRLGEARALLAEALEALRRQPTTGPHAWHPDAAEQRAAAKRAIRRFLDEERARYACPSSP